MSSLNLLAHVVIGNVDGHAIGIENNKGFSGLSPLFEIHLTYCPIFRDHITIAHGRLTKFSLYELKFHITIYCGVIIIVYI